MNKPSLIADDYKSKVDEYEGQASYLTNYDGGKRPVEGIKPRKASTGRPKTKNCHVYVAFCQEFHRTKIGISGHVMRRMTQLSLEIGSKVELIYSQYTVTAAGVDIERVALDKIGVLTGTEWSGTPPQAAVAAVDEAFAQVGKSRRVNPFISEDEARLERIARLHSHVVLG